MASLRLLAKNGFWNWANFATATIVTFFLTPFVIHSIGIERYGIWILAVGITGYYGLVDAGLRAAATQLTVTCIARRDYDELSRLLTAQSLILGACGLVVLALLPLVVWWAPTWFRLGDDFVHEARFSIAALGISFVLQLWLFPFGTIIIGLQRYGTSAAIGVSTRIAYVLGSVWVLARGHGLIGLCLVHVIATVLESMIRAAVAFALIPQFRFHSAGAPLRMAREVLSASWWNAVGVWGANLQTYTGSLLLGICTGPSSVAYFALARRLGEYYLKNFDPPLRVWFPAAAQLWEQKNLPRLSQLYHLGTRYTTVSCCLGACVMAVYARDFFFLWLSRGDQVAVDVDQLVKLLWLVLLAIVPQIHAILPAQILMGARKIREMGIATLIQSILHIGLAVTLVRPLGVYGVAISLVIPSFALNSWWYPWMVHKILHLRFSDYLVNTWLPGLVGMALLFPILHAISAWVPPQSWLQLFAHGGVAVALAGVCFWFVGLENYHRKALLDRVLSSRRFKRNQEMFIDREKNQGQDAQAIAVSNNTVGVTEADG